MAVSEGLTMHLRVLLLLLLGMLGIAGAVLLLTSEDGRYMMAALLFLVSGVLFSVVAIVDAAQARKAGSDPESDNELKPA